MQSARPAFPTTLFREFLPLSERNGVCRPGSIPGQTNSGDSEVGITEAQRAFALFSCFGEHLSPGLTDILHENSLQRRPFAATFRFFAYQAQSLYQIFSYFARKIFCAYRRFFYYFIVHNKLFFTKIRANRAKKGQNGGPRTSIGDFCLPFPLIFRSRIQF